MQFSENLQKLRKERNLSQEQLAEQLQVSRQAISKWENGIGYPETETLLAISELFNCSVDQLLKGSIVPRTPNVKLSYEMLMTSYRRGITIGVGIILLGVILLLYFSGIQTTGELQDRNGIIGVTLLLFCILIAVPMFIVYANQKEAFHKNNPEAKNLYTEKEVTTFTTKFTTAIIVGVTLILLGVMQLIFLSGMELVQRDSNIPVIFFMILVTIAVMIFVSYGIEKTKYTNPVMTEQIQENHLVSKINGVIMLVATMIFLLLGFVFHLWHINWLVYPLAGITCAVVAIIFDKKK